MKPKGLRVQAWTIMPTTCPPCTGDSPPASSRLIRSSTGSADDFLPEAASAVGSRIAKFLVSFLPLPPLWFSSFLQAWKCWAAPGSSFHFVFTSSELSHSLLVLNAISTPRTCIFLVFLAQFSFLNSRLIYPSIRSSPV